MRWARPTDEQTDGSPKIYLGIKHGYTYMHIIMYIHIVYIYMHK